MFKDFPPRRIIHEIFLSRRLICNGRRVYVLVVWVLVARHEQTCGIKGITKRIAIMGQFLPVFPSLFVVIPATVTEISPIFLLFLFPGHPLETKPPWIRQRVSEFPRKLPRVSVGR